MVAPNTGSLTTAFEDPSRNRTGTHVSTNIIIEVAGNAVGAIRQLSVNEARTIAMIDEVGTDGHIDSVPQKSTDISGSCQRTRFDGLRMAQAFSRPYVHVAAQRIPFDIVIKDIFAATGATPGEVDAAATLVTTIRNVWISKISVTYRADDFVIVEDMDWQAEHIYTTLGANNSAANGVPGARSLSLDPASPFEVAADKGDRRGALDGPGLLLAIDNLS